MILEVGYLGWAQLGWLVSVSCDVGWALICICGQLAAPQSHISDAWLDIDKGDGNNQATWCSSSNRLAWACSHGSNYRILKSSKRRQGPTCNDFFMPLLVSLSPIFRRPKQVMQPRTNSKVILYLLVRVTLRGECRQGWEESGTTSAY